MKAMEFAISGISLMFSKNIYLENLYGRSVGHDVANKVYVIYINIHIHTYIEVKGKAVPLQVWSGPEGSRKLRLPDFVTTAQDSGKVVSLTHLRPLPSGNTPVTRFF
jgi:hypothetical protein